ncbi:TetR family transcriptional regulator [Sphingomonas sp. SUN019]|uniref:TetR/AcrR family transcriptional regulator n=1 Tax=Sphingomonas sp. SUN019 TaxID=2937788 RepID=UPI002164457D|nr:TetR/AcrR family transcriptional regulator [Sphingomonas sp. SUN019]UVO49666.1 TetR family transcriptional regulator [Sphingomonas sp. SUN019]
MKIKSEELATRKPGRPAIDRREEILDAAERLYDRVGFEKTTIGDIARDLGMSSANLYRSFANRQAIDEAIAARKLVVLEDVAWSAARTASIDAPAALRGTVLAVMRQSLALLFSEERMHRLCAVATQSRWPVVEKFVHDLRGALRHIVIEGQNAGTFAAGDPDRISGALFAALSKVWHPAMLETYRTDDLEAEAQALCDLLLVGLKV